MITVKVRDIPSSGLTLTEKLPAEAVPLTPNDAMTFTQPFNVQGRVFRAQDVVVGEFDVTGQYSSFCARCLEPVTGLKWAATVTAEVPIDRATEYVDFDDELRQEILLNLPIQNLCREDCQGLCVGCGVNLNNETCQCKTKGK